VVRGLEQIGREVERGLWQEIAEQHNTRVQQLSIEHVRSVEQRYQGRQGQEREIAVEQARRQADRLRITPEKLVGLTWNDSALSVTVTNPDTTPRARFTATSAQKVRSSRSSTMPRSADWPEWCTTSTAVCRSIRS